MSIVAKLMCMLLDMPRLMYSDAPSHGQDIQSVNFSIFLSLKKGKPLPARPSHGTQ